jgi:hypothetical protein
MRRRLTVVLAAAAFVASAPDSVSAMICTDPQTLQRIACPPPSAGAKKKRYQDVDARHTELSDLIKSANAAVDAASIANPPDPAAIAAATAKMNAYADEQKQVYNEWKQLRQDLNITGNSAAQPAQQQPDAQQPDPKQPEDKQADAPSARPDAPADPDAGAPPATGPSAGDQSKGPSVDPDTGGGGRGGSPSGDSAGSAGGAKADDLGSSGSGNSKAGNSGSIGNLGGKLKSAMDGAGRLAAAENFGGNQAGQMGSPGGGPRGAMGAPGGAISGGPASPRSAQDFLLASGPYKDAFKDAGLKAVIGADGRAMVVRTDGQSAGPGEIAALKTAIEREPAALMRNPSFFDPGRGGISRQDFSQLKEIYRKDQGRRAADFKDIALTPADQERDFTHSRSCDIVSGDCNKHAKESYKKDDEVPASDLASIMDSIRANLNDAEEREKAAGEAGSSRVGGAAQRIKSFLSRMFGGGGGGTAGAATVASGDSGGQSSAAAAGVAGAASSNRGARGASNAGGNSASAAGRFDAGKAAAISLGVLGIALVAGAAFVLFRRSSWRRSS